MDKAQKLHANPVKAPVVQRAPFRIAAGLTAVLALSTAGYLMGGQDTKKNGKEATKVEERAPARITPRDLTVELDGKKAIAKPIDVHGVLGKKDDSILGKLWDAIGPTAAYAGDKNSIPVSEVQDGIKNTQKMLKDGVIQEVPFTYERQTNGYKKIKIAEWIIRYARNGIATEGAVANTLNPNPEAVPFVTSGIQHLAEKENKVDYEFVKGYVVKRPDGKGTALILACKDHLDIYVLNDKKETEWIPLIITDLGIDKKPSLAFEFGDSKRGKFIAIAVIDEDKIRSMNGARMLLAFVYPSPNVQLPKDDALTRTAIFTIASR